MERPHREITIVPKSPFFRVISEINFHIVFLIQAAAYFLLFGISVRGRKHLRTVEKCIFISNHIHYLDPGFIAHAVWPRRTYFTGLEETFRGNRFFSFFIRTLGGFPIPEDNPGRIVREVGTIIRETSRQVHLFPEGKMHGDHASLLPFMPGAFSLACFFDIPVIPIVEVLRPRKHWPFPKVTLLIGEAVYPGEFRAGSSSKRETSARMQAALERRMQETLNLYFT